MTNTTTSTAAITTPATRATLMEVGKTYVQTWVVLNCPRTARFTVNAISKTGTARGSYVDADGRTYSRHFVKPEKFGEWAVE